MKIHVLGISGSPIKGGNTELLVRSTLESVASEDVTTEFFGVAGKKISGCIHCNWCTKNQVEEKPCGLNDDMDVVYPKLIAADAIILASPVYIGRLSGQLACLLDRCRVFGHGSYYRETLKDKVGAAFAVGYRRNNGLEATLITLLSAFLLFRMIPVSPRSSFLGAAVVSSYYGEGHFDEDDYHPILKDELGLKRSKSAAFRAIEVARIVKAGKESVARG
jgi:multimeric flavodoxin WrbA